MKRLYSCLLALVVGALVVRPADAAITTKIVTNGSATVTSVPDQATVSASVVTNASSATDAVSQNNAIYARVVAALVKLGIARDDVTLSYYNVNYVPKPQPPATPQPYERYGYTVTRSFAVKVRKMTQAGAVVDAATAGGVTNVGGVSFGLANDAAQRTQAIDKAVADARRNAEALASAAHLRIIGIQNISMDGGEVRPLPLMRAMAASAPQMPTAFDAGNVSVSASVNVTFLAAP